VIWHQFRNRNKFGAIFACIFGEFAQIFSDFAKVITYFAQTSLDFSRSFTKSKLLGSFTKSKLPEFPGVSPNQSSNACTPALRLLHEYEKPMQQCLFDRNMSLMFVVIIRLMTCA